MNKPSEQHALTQVVPNPSIRSIPFDPQADRGLDHSSYDLKEDLYTLYDSRWLIGTIAIVVTLVAALYALAATSEYEANLMIHVEEESPNASKNVLSEASSLFETKKAAIAQIELLRSRMVVSRALDNAQQYIEVQPSYLPIVGAWLAKRNGDRLSRPGLFGYSGYVWGAEEAEMSMFEVPAPWLGRRFTLTALGNGRFRLADPDERAVFNGQVGQHHRWPTASGLIELKVGRLSANPGARFELRRSSRASMTRAIQNALVISEQGKLSGIIEVTLRGDNAFRTYHVLNEIGREYMRQNLARKTEEAEKSLAFLDQQLPILKRQLEQAEERYQRFRNANKTVDLPEEVRMRMAQTASARARRSDINKRRAELLLRYPEGHPMVALVDNERNEVEAEIRAINARLNTMPMLEQDETRLSRDIKVSSDLYTSLLNAAQQLRLTSMGRVSNVRLVDAPILPERPVAPNRPLIIALAAATGLFVGVVVAYMRKAVAGGIDDPKKIDHMLNARVVYTTIPHSSCQARGMRRARGDYLPLLATSEPDDPAIKSLRSFRAALLFSMPQFRNNIVMLASPTHRGGTSFVIANLASVLAGSGKRVLLIDADVRNGQLYRYFGVGRDYGLTRAILSPATAGEVIHRGVADKLDFIAAGEVPLDDAEVLLHPNFGNFLKEVSTHYDAVLIDSPPLLTDADALIIGAHAGAVFIVARAKRTNKGQIGESVNQLNRAGISLQGVLLNDTVPRLNAFTAPGRKTLHKGLAN